MAEKIKKNYSNGEITVIWQPDLCIHSKLCWHNLGEVFDPRKRPWVNMEGANTDAIISQVNKCPSGALSFKMNDEKEEESGNSESISIQIKDNGPILLKGKIEFDYKGGKMKMKKEVTALCRCGHSQNKPFCDGAHAREGFEG